MLNPKKKVVIVKKYELHKTDTGSVEVQISLLSEEIKELISHLKTHKKDNSSRRGLLKKVIQRKKLLNYLKREDKKRYNAIVEKLKL